MTPDRPSSLDVAALLKEAEELLEHLPDRGEYWYVEELRPGHEDLARVYGGGSWGICRPTHPYPHARRLIANFIAAAPRLIRALAAFASSPPPEGPEWKTPIERGEKLNPYPDPLPEGPLPDVEKGGPP